MELEDWNWEVGIYLKWEIGMRKSEIKRIGNAEVGDM
jgi:hypothetical protein